MKLLLHMCCGPCSAYPVKHLLEQGHQITGYFYNPNIHPYKEYKRRLDTAREYAAKAGLSMVVQDEYTLEDFLRTALEAPAGRCRACYELRLRQAAGYAKQHEFDCFSTTLLVSPYQQHEVIRQIGESIAQETGIPFHYEDYREGWQEGVALSIAMELYRQPYCGCIFSERDRYYKQKKAGRN